MKCPFPQKDGWTNVCKCGKKDDGQWYCTVKGYPPGQGPGEGGGEGGGGGCGGGNGDDPDDDDPLESCQGGIPMPISVSCTMPYERGNKVSCEAAPTLSQFDNDETFYGWSVFCRSEFVDGDQCDAVREGEGPKYKKWSGKATMNAGISVRIRAYDENDSLFVGTKTEWVWVRKRQGWAGVGSTNAWAGTAKLNRKSLAPKPDGYWKIKSYGRYYTGWDLARTPDYSTKKGSGPWAGTRYLKKMPKFKSEKDRLYTHPDLYSWGKDYGGAWKHCGNVPTKTDVNVRTMNDECGTGVILNRWRDYAEEHEKKHMASYNKCVYSMRLRAEASDVEAVAAKDANMGTAVSRARNKLWEDLLGPAVETNQRWKAPADMRQWRVSRRWTKVLPAIGSHSGTNGC